MSERGISKIHSAEYQATLVRQERLTVDPAKFRRAVSARDFVSAVAISVTAARQLLGGKKLRNISQVAESVSLRITAIEAQPRSSRCAERRAADA